VLFGAADIGIWSAKARAAGRLLNFSAVSHHAHFYDEGHDEQTAQEKRLGYWR